MRALATLTQIVAKSALDAGCALPHGAGRSRMGPAVWAPDGSNPDGSPMRIHSRHIAAALALLVAVAVVPFGGRGANAQDRSPPAAPRGPAIELVVEGLRGEGHVRAGAYGDARSWLGQTAAARCAAPVQSGRARCTMQLPSAGVYAIGLYHDADDDNELDRGVFGVPTEGYGFSRNVGGGLSAPGFAEAALQVAADALVRAVVRIRYGL
jgi:uncharacterized protein (DUF2141 family)